MIPWQETARRALEEDAAFDDATTRLLGGRAALSTVGRIRAEGTFVVAGLPLVETVFRELDGEASCERHVDEGEMAADGAVVLTVRASARALLAGERVALPRRSVKRADSKPSFAQSTIS